MVIMHEIRQSDNIESSRVKRWRNYREVLQDHVINRLKAKLTKKSKAK